MREPVTDASSPMPIELRHLRYFLAVVEHSHFGHAAEELHISQPPVSRAIRQLEDELGVQLLERRHSGVVTTEAGTVFAEHAEAIVSRLDLAIAETRRAGGASSTLRVGTLDILPIDRVQSFLISLRLLEPALEVSITHLPSLEQIKRLREQTLDVGILIRAEDHRDIETQSLFPGEAIEAVVRRDHRLAHRRVLGPDDLRDEVFLTGARALNPGVYDRFVALIEAAGYSFRSIQSTDVNNPRDLILEVAASDSVLLRPLSFRAVDEASINVVRCALDPEPTMPDTVIAWRSNPPHHLGRILDTARELASVGPAAAA
jgi:DNA-binding transcriptional LysR family regulator